ncbi:MAG: polar amino acid transport system substrate-binding protein, partial [Candidatus Eremiobacteraeota bacterium]|nr:polar amino acid transport system substrate-binding protein [Candidatus Eremiobacteraeota bacterium]
ALAALADVRAAVAEIVRIEDGYAVGHGAYLRAAHRAMNALVGRRDDGYAASFGDPGDGVGTLGHLDRMLDKTATARWTPAVQGAKANVLAAAENLQSALHDKQMEDYQADLTRALASLALVVGRSSESGVLGGLSGALANTSLGVPRGAASAPGCAPPSRGPSYGVVAERLTYVALPRTTASAAIPAELSVSRVVVHGDDVVLYTHAERETAVLCRGHARMQRTRAVAAPAVAYTAAQAHAGAAVYRRYCLQCHAVNLQGSAGPAVAGTEFLATAQRNKWTLNDLRTTVFENMPFSNPGSLTPKQYADVMGFLLASNCYPPGAQPFPQKPSPALAKVKLGPVHGAKPTNPSLGTCAVK